MDRFAKLGEGGAGVPGSAKALPVDEGELTRRVGVVAG